MVHSSFLTIIKGKYKNKKIPVPKKIHGHNNVTPQKIKESVFQIIDNHLEKTSESTLENTIFIDLFSGSGQMGAEAISRGFIHAFFFDISKERIQKLRIWIQQNMDREYRNCTFDVRDGVREFRKILTSESSITEFLSKNKNINQVVIFADPPYGLNSKRKYLIEYLIDSFNQFKDTNPELNKDYSIILIIQTSREDLFRSSYRTYGESTETRNQDHVKGYYEYGRHRILVM